MNSNKIYIEKEIIMSAILNRLSAIDLAKRLNCSPSVIYKRASEYNLSFSNTKRNNEKWNDTRHRVLYYYQSNAKCNKRNFTLTDEEFFNIITQPCIYCGRQQNSICEVKSYWSMSKNRKSFNYTGIDRLNNNEGYTLKNSIPCCFICNRAKRELTEEEFRNWIKDIINFNNKNEQ